MQRCAMTGHVNIQGNSAEPYSTQINNVNLSTRMLDAALSIFYMNGYDADEVEQYIPSMISIEIASAPYDVLTRWS